MGGLSRSDSGKGYYIVFHSVGDVETDLETKGDTGTIKCNITNLQDDVVKQNPFHLTTEPELDIIDVVLTQCLLKT